MAGDQRTHTCDVCHKSFLHATDLSLHKKYHDPDKKFDCNVCGREFNRLNNLQRHMMVHQQVRMINTILMFKSFEFHKKRKYFHISFAISFIFSAICTYYININCINYINEGIYIIVYLKNKKNNFQIFLIIKLNFFLCINFSKEQTKKYYLAMYVVSRINS